MASRAASRAVCRRGDRRVGPVGDGKELSWQQVGRLPSSIIVGPVGLRLHDGGVFEPQAGAGDLLGSKRGAYLQSVQTADDLTRLVRERVRQVLFREGLAVVDYFEGCNVAIESHRGRL